MPKARTARLQPNSILRRQYKKESQIIPDWEQTNDKFRRAEKRLPELAAEALLKLQKVSTYKQTRSLVTIDILLPLSKSSLDKLKEWDSPIGRAAKAFDDSITSVQKKIGGEQVPEIFGNELKLRIICYLRGEQRHKNAVDEACQRLHGHNEQQAVQQENEMRNSLVQLFEDCGNPTKTNQQSDLLQICDELSRKTLDLEEATQDLITFREQLQQRLQDGGKVEQQDIDKAAKIIRKGGLGMPRSSDEDWATEMAAWYLGAVITSAEPNKNNQPECQAMPTWATETWATAQDIPKDRIASLEAFYIISNGPYKDTYGAEDQLGGNEKCWSASGLRASKPINWDKLSAALVYVNKSIGTWRVICKACESERIEEWQLRCGSTKASTAV
ncbi:hypothetical protein MGU_11179 [Metarhizium guizhouense ARSEF 977]|uniref:Uncharacterized protein n=1 Tax=Metarhizium guizhouense (strain ARSEF 977) TaxID=1276136 RepID=A0A0B4GP16_METGA|nr:hypothetical protein MGU_11179 [Metarhizium guizhouense ARSEF 977]